MRIAVWMAALAFGLFANSARAETFRLNYDAAVLGVVVLGTASYEITSNATSYAARANVRTSGLARLFDQTEINATSTGTLSGAAASWSSYDISHAYSGKFRRINLDRSAAGVAAEVSPRFGGMGDPEATESQRMGSYDPLSAIFALGRQVGAARGCRGSTLVFDGRLHYRLALSGGGEETYNAGGYNGPAVTCQFRYEPIAGFNLTAQERARIPVGQATFALPADAAFAPPLRLTAPSPAGNVSITVSEYQRVN